MKSANVRRKPVLEQDGKDWDGVAIIGYTPHREQAPFENPKWKKWGLNDLYLDLPVISNEQLEWFQIHPWADGRPVQSVLDHSAGPHHPRDANHISWLAEAAKRIPVWLVEDRPEVPKGQSYPYDEVYTYFNSRYFTNSISYMIALAIMRGFKKIGVYGVDMMTSGGAGSEYGYQRPSCEWLLGYAQAKIGPENVIIPKESDLLATAYTYADEVGNQFRDKFSFEAAELQKRIESVSASMNQQSHARAELTGAKNAYEGILRRWMPGDDMHENPGAAPVEHGNRVPNKE